MYFSQQQIKQDSYPSNISDIPLISYKFALQLIPYSGFDSTGKLQRASKEDQEKATSDRCTYFQAIQPVIELLTKSCSMDYEFMNEIINNKDPDPMSDAFYVKSHATMESLEQLFDNYENQFEYPLYDNFKKYGLEISLEDQRVSTLTPLQTYLAPQDVRIFCPNIRAKPSHIQYFAPPQNECLQVSVTPHYASVQSPNLQQKSYIHNLLHVTSHDLNADYICRQFSAHEQWVSIICDGLGLKKLSMEKCYFQLTQLREEQLDAEISKIEVTDLETVKSQLEVNFNVNKINTQILTSQIIDNLVEICINQMKELFKWQLEPQLRGYEFNGDFDISVRGLIESKSVTHSFYQFDQDSKISFIKPIIAQKLLNYQKMGKFSRAINLGLNNQEQLFGKIEHSQEDLYTILQKMNDKFFQCVKKQHQLLLRALLTSIYSLDYIKTEFDESKEINIDINYDKMMLKPMCSCYACNFWCTYDKIDIADKIFPIIKIRKISDAQIYKFAQQLSKKDINNYYNYSFNPKTFVDNAFNMEYNAQLLSIFPYFSKMNKEINNKLGINLLFNEQYIDKINSQKYQNNIKELIHIYPYSYLLEYVQVFSLLIPNFAQFPAPYGQISNIYPPIVLSEQYRKSQPFDPRLETLLCIISDPTKLAEQSKQLEEKLQLHGRYNHRTVMQVQNQIVQRNIYNDCNIKYAPLYLKNPNEYSDYEVASILFTQKELEQYEALKKDRTIVNASSRDVREASVVQYNVKNLLSLLIAKKYNGTIPDQPSTKGQSQSITQKLVNDKLKVEVADLQLINKIFNIIYSDNDDSEKTDDIADEIDNYSLYETQKQSTNIVLQ